MFYTKKYKMGEPITSLDELAKQEFVYVHGRINHNGWVQSMQFRLLRTYIENEYIRYAIKIEQEDEDGNA